MIFRGKLLRAAGGRAWVTIPRRGGNRVYGGHAGCDIYVQDPEATLLVEGADVLVAFVEGREADPVVIAVR